jgi:hypothetical protein
VNQDVTLSRIDSIEKMSIYIGAALAAGSLLFRSLPMTLGVVLGGLVVILNFRWLRRLIERALTKKGGLKKALYAEYALKLILFLGVVGVVVYYRKSLWDVDPLGFLVGLSTVFIAICVEGLRGALKGVG